jgi:hypothetical protein
MAIGGPSFPGGTNLLLIDETEIGLFPGGASFGGTGLPDELDALVLKVHRGDRPLLISLALQARSQSVIANPAAPPQQQYRTGPGYSYSLLRFAKQQGIDLRIRVGFSVTTSAIGLRGTAVDHQAGLEPTMEQAGDIFFTQFGMWEDMPGFIYTAWYPSGLGQNWRWYDEEEIGLSEGAWALPAAPGLSLALLPDELNALDTTCSAPYIPSGYTMVYGTPYPIFGTVSPLLTPHGWASVSSYLGFTVHNAPPNSPVFVILGYDPADPAQWSLGGALPFGLNLYIAANSIFFSGLLGFTDQLGKLPPIRAPAALFQALALPISTAFTVQVLIPYPGAPSPCGPAAPVACYAVSNAVYVQVQ